MRHIHLSLVAAVFLISICAAQAQNAVAIGTTTANPKAVLTLVGSNQGLIIPKVSDPTAIGATAAEAGMIVFNTTDSKVYAFNGTTWNTVGASGSGSTYTLSYDATTKIISLVSGSSGTPTINISTTTLTGDLGGTLATPTVTGIQGKGITLPSSGVQYLSYDVTQGKWVFQTPAGSGDMLKATYDPTNKNADAFDLTKHSGILPIANGGTGITTVPTANQVLTTNGSSIVGWTNISALPSGPVLSATQVLTGNGTTNSATILTGDASINSGSLKVTGLQAKVLPALPVSLQYLAYDGTTSAWKFQTPASAVFGNLTTTTAGLTITGGTGAVAGTGSTVNIQNATTSQPGLLTAADWTSFNSKVSLAGDLGGTSANPTIAKLQGQAYTFPASNLTAGVLTNPGTGAPLTWSPVTGFLTSALPSGDIIVGNASGVATPTIMNGDATIDNAGKVTIGNSAITSAKIVDGTITDADIAAGAGIVDTKLATIITAGKVDGGAITSGTIGGTTIINTSGDILTTGGSLSVSGTTTFGGIKYSWPTTPLAAGTTYLSTDNSGNLSWVNGSSDWGLSGNSLGGTEFIGSTNSADLVFKTNNTEAARLTTGGNFGVGTSSPVTVLHAVWNAGGNIGAIATIETSGAGSAAPLRFKNASGQSINMGILSTGDFSISSLNNNVSVSDVIRITAAGNVGIGSSNPAYKLSLSGNFAMDNTNSLLAKNSVGTYETYMWPRWSDNVMYLNYGSAGFNIRNNSSTPVMFMTTAGNVGIGTTSPGYLLHVNGSASVNNFNVSTVTSGALSSSATFNGGVLFQKQLILNSATNVTGNVVSTFDGVYDLGSTSNHWNTVYATTGTIQTSDIRLKQNVKSLNYGLNEVMSLRPVSYTWKKDSTNKIILGLIAQEVLKVVPEAVNVPKDGGYLGMNYSNLVPVLIKSIQEQQKLIDDQKKQIEELKGQQNQKETAAQSELNQLKVEIANIKKALGMEASTKKK